MFFGGSPVIPIPSLRIPMIFLWFSLWYSKYRTRCFFGGSPVIPIPSLRIPMIFLWFSYDIPNIGPDVFWGSPVIPIPSLRIPMIFLWFSYDIPNIGPDVFWGGSCHSYPVTEDSNDFPVIFLWYSKYRTRCFLSRHWGFQWFSCGFPMIFQI